ncbi:MAG TPA: rhomboid family intramembrane serine protease [Desulfosalsimonadaceae bacterium]|nr:rhomboid family intramembrane serine protease [Desulfosalsimonadaceae bacterium]
MIPIRDTIPSRNYPVVNNTLIGINVVVYVLQLAQGGRMSEFVYTYGLVPAKFTVPHIAAHFSTGQLLFSLLSFMFLHGGFLHILGNMWSLYIFGDNVEDRLGSVYYLFFFLLSGFFSGLCHFFLNIHSTAPVIGASGAIAGVMGAYFILYPTSRILTLIPVLIFPLFVEIPAFFFLGLWFLLQLLNAAASGGAMSGIAWWAHIGGFLFGIAALKTLGVMPETRFGDTLRRAVMQKKKSPRFQVIQPRGGTGSREENNLYDTIRITPYEAAAGAKKRINIPRGLTNRFFNVLIPPGTRDGSILRLKGLGRKGPDGEQGDLYLTVRIHQPW